MVNEFEIFWNPFIRVFQALCVSHYSICRSNVRSWKYILYFIVFWMIYIYSVFATTNFSPFREGFNRKENRQKNLMYHVNSVCVISSFVVHIIMPLEGLSNGKQEAEIYRKFKRINDIFVNKLNYHPDYIARRAKYLYRTVPLFVFVVILAYTSGFTRLPNLYDDIFVMKPTMIIDVIVLRVRWCQIALYLHVIADTLNDLQISLQKHQKQICESLNDQTESAHTKACQTIHSFREIYLNIWQITKLISECFGWSLIGLLVKVMLEHISGIYWFYINLKQLNSIGLSLRKHEYVFSYLFYI